MKSLPDSEKFDFSCIEYELYKRPVKIWCKTHDTLFSVTPENFFAGTRCPECAVNGYSRNRGGSLYIVSSDEMTKVGITNRRVSRRSREISCASGDRFKLVNYWTFQDGSIPLTIETTLLRELRLKYTQPTEKFDGSTECFYDVDIPQLLSRVEELIKAH